jgi:hypothetical protein
MVVYAPFDLKRFCFIVSVEGKWDKLFLMTTAYSSNYFFTVWNGRACIQKKCKSTVQALM